jgi:photolyase PhrII
MIDRLPSHLAERTRQLNSIDTLYGDGPVVVWLKSSFRVHENPAIEVGATIAQQNGLPLLIYHGIDERYPHASLRHHNMLLEAAIDMDENCRKNGLRYVLHLAREGHRQPVLKQFSQTASCIVTDMFPLPPWTEWLQTISASSKGPVFDVDCHCVVPMPMFGKSVDRPYKYRDATKKLRKKRLQASWPVLDVQAEQYAGELPFEPVDIANRVIDPNERIALLQECNIDPTVLPIWEVRGGEKAALQKWQKFFDKGLNGYARRRNNAADSTGVSRLSHAFHYGFLSPMRVAREAAAVGTKSADKYLDELLVFREHAWHHIYAVPEPYAPSNLPDWAKQSWRDTSDDPRPVLLTPRQLEYAASPFELWNLCQQSLVRHGELHNNLRMTWGKAFPLWTQHLESSLEQSQMLNDKYALDGRDPSSVVGIQWCHGLFDRAFFPSEPVMGVVRKRDVVTHSSRLDTERYGAHVNRNPSQIDGVYILQGRNPITSFVADVLTDQGYSAHFTETEDVSSSIDSIPSLSDHDFQRCPTWLVEKYLALDEEMHVQKNSAAPSHISDGQTEDGSTDHVEHRHHTALSIISMIEGRLAFTAVPPESDPSFSTGRYSEHSVPLVEQLRHAAWDLARRMFELHAHQSESAYAVQTRLF